MKTADDQADFNEFIKPYLHDVIGGVITQIRVLCVPKT